MVCPSKKRLTERLRWSLEILALKLRETLRR